MDVIMQMAKRIFLFLMVNLLVVTTVSIILGVLGVGRFFPRGGIGSLAVICLVWGFVGAFISLALSRVMAKWMMGVQVISPETTDPDLRELVNMVHQLARAANLPALPEVGVYESEEINAFATGPTRSRALVAVSSGLLARMRTNEISGVIAHEITHVANGDMVTMTLVQGVINAFVMFLSRVLAFFVLQALRGRDDEDRDRGGGFWIEWLLIQLFQVVFSLLGWIVTAWFSRIREYAADAGGARLAGRTNMIQALQALQRLNDPEVLAAEAQNAPAFAAFKISGGGNYLNLLLADHPPLAERIARLEQGTY